MPAQAPGAGLATRTRKPPSKPATLPRSSQLTPPRAGGSHFSRAGGASGASPSRSGRQPASRRQGGGPTFRGAKADLKSVSPQTPKLAAEFLVCVLIITISTFTKPGDYAVKMSQALWRLTAVTALFFVLALWSMSEKYGKIATAFGVLIVAGVLYHAGKDISGTINEVAGMGQTDPTTGKAVDTAVLTADVTTAAPPHNLLQADASDSTPDTSTPSSGTPATSTPAKAKKGTKGPIGKAPTIADPAKHPVTIT